MDGSHLLTINPATLDDESLWSYADLQKLAKALDVRASGKRNELVERLMDWHKTRTGDGHSLVAQDGAEDIPLNVDGANFAILSMHIRPRSPVAESVGAPTMVSRSASRSPVRSPMRSGLGGCYATDAVGSVKKSTSLVGLSDSPLIVSPTLLKPLAPTTPSRTPGKSALKSPGKSGVKASRIKFSPYNGTKVIPNRREAAKTSDCDSEWCLSGGGVEEDSLDDENDYVDEQARINAERNVFVCSADDAWQSEF